MVWGRVLLGFLVSALVVGGLVAVTLQMRQSSTLPAMAPPGLAEADVEALAAPSRDLFAGRIDAIVTRLVPQVDRSVARAELDRLRASVVPSSPVRSSRLLIWRSTRGANGRWLAGAHEHDFGGHVGRSETVLFRENDRTPWQIETFNIEIVPRSAASAAGIDIRGKAPSYVALVAAAIVNPMFMLATFWAALLSKRVRRRWVWLIAVPLAFVTFNLNAATGEIGVNPLSVQVFGAAATWSGSAFDAWVLSVAIPFGAIAFWLAHAFRR